MKPAAGRSRRTSCRNFPAAGSVQRAGCAWRQVYMGRGRGVRLRKGCRILITSHIIPFYIQWTRNRWNGGPEHLLPRRTGLVCCLLLVLYSVYSLPNSIQHKTPDPPFPLVNARDTTRRSRASTMSDKARKTRLSYRYSRACCGVVYIRIRDRTRFLSFVRH